MLLIIVAVLIPLFISSSDAGVVYAQAEGKSETSSEAKPKDKADFVYKVLLDSYNKYLDDVFKTAGLGLLVIGWLFTSDKTRQFLQENRNIRITVLIIVVLLSMVHLYSLYQDYVETNGLWDLLKEIGYMPPEYFMRYRITYDKIIGSMLISFVGFVVAFVSIYSLKSKATDDAA
jgi:hypothetical protein